MELVNRNSGLIGDVSVTDTKNNVKESSFSNFQNQAFSNVLNMILNKKDGNSHGDSASSNILNMDDKDKIQMQINELRRHELEGQEDSALTRLAAKLGMSKEMLKFIMRALGINPEDLLNPNMKDKILDKLSGYLKKGQSKKDLSDLLDSFYPKK